MSVDLEKLSREIRACEICKDALVDGVRPVFQVSETSKILIVGQAPGRKVHETGVPFDDPSGDRLRDWLGVSKDVFYDARQMAIVPMGFCFPGTGKSGDLPPRKECAPAWRDELLQCLRNVSLTIVIGQYAMDWHLPLDRPRTVTDTVKAWQNYWPDTVVLPHPSPRNNIWLKKNAWFEVDILPALRARVASLL
ncbi:uracil-DNA glycosylase family protein [Kordiimonas aquimaris]|uniref:uracil-DNA glycosylase family protein n=1 Tax=Kordiimonas aquimaris TaxID=707591 RepID=UPI00374D6D8A